MAFVSLFLIALSWSAPQTPVTAESRVGMIAGCWEQKGATRTVREEWRVVSPDFLIGTSTTVVGGAVREFEFLRVESKAGVIDYVAQPGGVPPTRFTLDPSSKADVLIFANPQHDFPKRIGYTKVGPDALTAWIDGGEGTRKIEFPFRLCRAE